MKICLSYEIPRLPTIEIFQRKFGEWDIEDLRNDVNQVTKAYRKCVSFIEKKLGPLEDLLRDEGGITLESGIDSIEDLCSHGLNFRFTTEEIKKLQNFLVKFIGSVGVPNEIFCNEEDKDTRNRLFDCVNRVLARYKKRVELRSPLAYWGSSEDHLPAEYFGEVVPCKEK